jgi:hypothetical protein
MFPFGSSASSSEPYLTVLTTENGTRTAMQQRPIVFRRLFIENASRGSFFPRRLTGAYFSGGART